MMHSAMAALLSFAGMAGIEPAFIEVSPVRASSSVSGPKEVLRLPFDDIMRDQERAEVARDVGRGRIGFRAALDPEAALWVRIRQGRRTSAHTLDSLALGVTEHFPVESYRFLYENGLLRASPLNPPQAPSATLSVAGLIRRLYDVSLHVLFTPVEYAVVIEERGPVPASVSLIRQDRSGTLWITHKSLEELASIQWFVAINGVKYGMKLSGRTLVFYSEPTSSLGVLVTIGERSIL